MFLELEASDAATLSRRCAGADSGGCGLGLPIYAHTHLRIQACRVVVPL